MKNVAIIGERTQSFADEWQARDVTLSRSEEATVRRACHALGIPLAHKPTGRTAQLVLQHCQALALRNASQAQGNVERDAWKRTFALAQRSLGTMLN